MQIVINIPDEKYERLIKQMQLDRNFRACKISLLPKRHGDLIDINEITAFKELECNGHNVESLDEFTVIIEADKAESEESR